MVSKLEKLIDEILELLEKAKRREINPFDVDVKSLLDELSKLFPKLRSEDEYSLDMKALHSLALLIKEQEEFVRSESALLVLGPLLALLRARVMSSEELATLFIESWNPIVELEQLTTERMEQALDYWIKLTKYGVRREKSLPSISDVVFERKLEEVEKELKEKLGESGKVDYWNFIVSNDFRETVFRAYCISFLATQGKILLYRNPLGDEIFILPPEDTESPGSSMVIVISKDILDRVRKKNVS
ncbi:MAG: hypothetical protein B6U94_02605 [Thermofilum sp. ex4484_79]|nr:MAG: hypothetical protein B6U94_02605 [Thermofilum sp. ex4484_79]